MELGSGFTDERTLTRNYTLAQTRTEERRDETGREAAATRALRAALLEKSSEFTKEALTQVLADAPW